MQEFDVLEDILGYKFKNIELLKTALTHSSYANEHNCINYERMEFLGDSVLSIVVSEYLFEAMKNNNEGDLSRIRASLVCETTLADVAKKIGLREFILLGNGEERANSRNRNSILSDVFESTLAAIYLDSGFVECKKFVYRVMKNKLDENCSIGSQKDFKSKLQEAVQQKHHGKSKISYKVIKESGPEHNKFFEVELSINEKEISTGTGNSKKSAEQEAASKALSVFGL